MALRRHAESSAEDQLLTHRGEALKATITGRGVSSSHTHWLCQILQQTNPTAPVSVDGRDGVFVMLVVSANAFQPHLRVTPFARTASSPSRAGCLEKLFPC
jgi:hypothetical protein